MALLEPISLKCYGSFPKLKMSNTTQPVRQVVIFAGGLGSRLGELTRRTPKPMISVAGRPYLEWQIELLRAQGLRDFLLLTCYLADQIEEYFGDGNRWNVRIKSSREPQPLGTAAALKLAESRLSERFLLMNGDTFFPMDYTALLDRADRISTTAWMVVVPKNVFDTEDSN